MYRSLHKSAKGNDMTRRHWLGRIAMLSLVGAATALLSENANAQNKMQSGKSDIFTRCAQACRDCEKTCTACNKHCTGMVKAGMKEHEKSQQLSADCRDLCAAAAKIVARRGPMSAAACKSCAEACDACGAECAKHPDMAVMKACMASCAACAKACRAMIATAKG